MSTNEPIDPELVNSPQRRKLKGVALEVALSPYDVPEQVTGGYCVDKNKFIIRFLYPAGAGEPMTERAVSEHLVAREGVHSGRLYFIEVDVDGLDVDQIQLKVKQHLTEGIRAFEAPKTFGPPLRSTDRSTLLSEMNARVLGQLRDRYIDRFITPSGSAAATGWVRIEDEDEFASSSANRATSSGAFPR